MLLYLVRHGETDLNLQDVYQGHLPTPLNDAGRKQAERLGEYLRFVPFKQCWSSHLPRAAETAKIIAGPYHPKVFIQLEPLIADRAMGELGGKSKVADLALEGVAPGVESDVALVARLRTFLSHLVQTHTPLSSPLISPRSPSTPSDQGAGCVLVVTHEACLLALLRILTDAPIERFLPEAQGPDVSVLTNKDAEEHDGLQGRPSLTILTSPAPTVPDTSKSSTLSCVIDTQIPSDVDVGQQCGNAALCVVRIWWEDAAPGAGRGYLDKGLVVKGRVEAWGDVGHLDE